MPDTWSLELIREIEWRSFEKLCAEYFLAKGYKVVETGAGKDGGVDLYLFKALKGDGLKYDHKPFSAIQCKSWLTKQIGVKTVRELYGVMAAENIKLGAVVASGYFTDDAMAFAKGKHLQLISGARLLKLITALPVDTQSTLLKKIIASDYKIPSCPTCDIKMVKRTSKKSNSDGLPFWGCSNFPKCRHIQNIRNA
jgi:restriction system protein